MHTYIWIIKCYVSQCMTSNQKLLLNGIHKHTLTFSFIWDQNTADITRSRALKRPYWSICEIKFGAEYSCIWYICLNVLVTMTSMQNIAILGAQGHLMLMGSKFLQKTNICSLVIFTKNLDSINIRKPWVPEITMFHKEVIMIKTSKNVYQKQETLVAHFNFSN